MNASTPCPRLLRVLIMTGVLSATIRMPAADLSWDADTDLSGIQEGDGTWTASSTHFWNGTANATPAKGTDNIVFGSGSGVGGTVTISNGGAILNYADATSSSALIFNRSYILAGAEAGDGISIGNIAINNSSTVTISAIITSNAARNWGINTGVLNLSGGGSLQNMTASGAAQVNISAGSWSVLGSLWGGGNGNLVVNHTGGAINGGFNVGGNNASSTTTSATFNLNGGTIVTGGAAISLGASSSANVGDSIINIISGSITGPSSELRIGNDGGKGTLNISGGTVTAGKAIIGRRANTSAALNSTFNISGGVTTLNQIQFDDIRSDWVSGSSGAFNLSGGTLYLNNGGITRNGTNANFSYFINLSGGTLGAVNNWTSSLDVSLTGSGEGVTFRAADIDGTARNITLTGALTGTGGFTKTGGGTLFLNGVSKTFTGDVFIKAGTLSSNTAFIANTASLYLTSGSTLNLNFSGTNSIASLFIDGVQQNMGTYSSANLAGLITGAGTLNVLNAIPEPATVALFAGISAIGFVATRRRKTAKV